MQFELAETHCAPLAWWQSVMIFGFLFFVVVFIVFLIYQVAKYFYFNSKLRRMGDYEAMSREERLTVYQGIWRLSWPLFFFALGVFVLAVAGVVVVLFSPVMSDCYDPLSEGLGRSTGFSFIALVFGFFTLCIWGIQQGMFDKFIGRLSIDDGFAENEEN